MEAPLLWGKTPLADELLAPRAIPVPVPLSQPANAGPAVSSQSVPAMWSPGWIDLERPRRRNRRRAIVQHRRPRRAPRAPTPVCPQSTGRAGQADHRLGPDQGRLGQVAQGWKPRRRQGLRSRKRHAAQGAARALPAAVGRSCPQRSGLAAPVRQFLFRPPYQPGAGSRRRAGYRGSAGNGALALWLSGGPGIVARLDCPRPGRMGQTGRRTAAPDIRSGRSQRCFSFRCHFGDVAAALRRSCQRNGRYRRD